MATAKGTIENEIRTRILAAPAPLNGLQLVIRGMAYRVPTNLYPFAQVFIINEVSESGLTGNRIERVYTGIISVHVSIADVLVVNDRRADMPSYALVQDLVDALTELFSTVGGSSLNNLAFTNGVVTEFMVGESAIEYGIADDDMRVNNYENYGAVPFVARTLEAIS